MKAQLQELLEIDHILGVMFFTFEGKKLYEEFTSTAFQITPPDHDWPNLIKSLEGAKEADLLFENKRLYFRRADNGYLMVIMESDGPAAMVRLSCDTIIPSLKAAKRGKGLFNRFK